MAPTRMMAQVNQVQEWMACGVTYLIDLNDAPTSIWRGQLSKVGRYDNRGCSDACPYDQAADDKAPAKSSRIT